MTKKRIIFIDDSILITSALKKIVEDIDHIESYERDDAIKGLQLIEELDYQLDLIILDYNMPGMSGIEMLRKLKAKRPDFPVPVLMLTTELEQKSDESKKLGVVSWILKPFKEEKIKEMINLVFQHYPVRR